MTTDMENELRELFRDKAGEAPLATPAAPATAPPHVLRRGRRRQIGTVLGSVAAVVVLIAGSVAGLQRLLDEGPEPLPTGGYDVFERTATVEAFTVSSPSDWYLVNEWPLSMQIAVEGSGGSSSACIAVPGNDVVECEDTPGVETLSPIPAPLGLPMLQLTNVDLGLDANACRDGLPSTATVLYIAVDPGASLAPDAGSLAPYPIGPGLPGPADGGPCGPGIYAHFTVNGTPMFFWIGVGDGATEEDRATVMRTAEMMYADDHWEPTPPDSVTPGYVIAGGDGWRLELRPDGDAVELSLQDGPAPTVLSTDGSVEPLTWTGTDPIFGAISKPASGVEFRPDDGGAPITGMVVPMPPTMGLDFDLFFLEGVEGLSGEVVAVGLGPGIGQSPSPQPDPKPDVVSLSGGDETHMWIARFSGAFDDGSACITVRIDGGQADRLCPGAPDIESSFAAQNPSLHGWLESSYYLLAGSVPPEVQDIRFVPDEGTTGRIFELQCTTGPVGWPDKKVCAIRLPGEGSGMIEYLDGDGNVLFEEGWGWGAADAALPPGFVNPTHGGTYWAVYPWLGSPGDPVADEISAQLATAFGIEAFPGDLACDEGAAAALGADAEQGIGVYFETRQDAEAFVNQVVDGNVVTEAPIAQVTTYCLD